MAASLICNHLSGPFLAILTRRHFLTFLVEAFPAELAHKRLVSRVDAHVRVERGAPVERLPAVVALVRLFLRR